MRVERQEKRSAAPVPAPPKGFRITLLGFLGYLAVLGVFFLLLLDTYTVVSARSLDYEINRSIDAQSKLQQEIAVLETEIAEQEAIPCLVARMEEFDLKLGPCPIPVIPVVERKVAEKDK
jgi:hypothetical protein